MIDIENYNNSNVFAKVLRKEINSKKIYEDEFAFAFEDISPQAPTHILIIPKGQYCSLNDFLENAEDNFLVGFMKAIKKVVDVAKLNNGYRLITNIGNFGGQEVPHLHFHLLSGKLLTKLVSD